jgi:tetratricopeptide (TPR) repeat protein
MKIIILSTLLILISFGAMAKNDSYELGQREFSRKNFSKSNKIFEKFIVDNKLSKDKETRSKILWAVDLVVRTHLQTFKDPDSALKFLNKVDGLLKLNDAEDDIIQEWISVTKEWKKLGKLPKNIKEKEELFKLGESFYLAAKNKKNRENTKAGKIEFYIASTYLVPYVYNFDDSKNIGKALLMLGNIRLRSWNDYDYWSENFYLKEVIRRFPHTALAKEAYTSLESGIRIGYTGSGGDFTPPSQLKMLKFYKKFSEPKKHTKPLIY